MPDKSKRPTSSCSGKPQALKKKTVTKELKDSERSSADIKVSEQMSLQALDGKPVESTEQGTVELQGSAHGGARDERAVEESDTPDLLSSSPNLDEATTSSPVLARPGTSLHRIRTQIRQAKAAESRDALKAVSETEDTADSDVDSGDTNTSLDASTRSIGGNRMLLNELPRHANEIFQRTKAELEKSSNLKREIRESVVSGLYILYEMVLKLSDSRMLHMLESNKQKLNTSRESERLTQRHARFMHETLGQYALLKEDIKKLQKETESTRLILSYDICEAVTATKREVVNVKNEISTGPPIKDQIQALTEEFKLFRGNIDSLLKQFRQESGSTHLVEELRELRRVFNEYGLRKEPTQPPCSPLTQDFRDQESVEQQHRKTELLHQQVVDLRMQLNAEVAEIREEINSMSKDIKELTVASSNSPLPSVQANLEELRRENRELRDITVDSAAPIRLAIESLRKELKNQLYVGEADLSEHKCKSQDLNDQEQKHHSTSHNYRTPHSPSRKS
ncbi:unnamed protein product [Parnassius apollo]|uniref:(apollo) hypothetical protein n=1 Tax=Parnassius apollo TaxID=110799 RepID=A0A8S3X7D2_PARAO|nr:unnamed protein product [Parnassius apollo]